MNNIKITALKYSILFLLISLVTSCSTKNEIYGTWKLTAEINSENPYANRSSLTETKIKSNKTITLNRDSTFVSNLLLCNQYPPNDTIISKGVYHFKKPKNPDKLFWLECKDVYPIFYFKMNNKKLELYYPSFGSGYKIKIFDCY